MSESAVLSTPTPERDETTTPAPEPTASVDQLLVEDDLVIEEVSIDGMCGVY